MNTRKTVYNKLFKEETKLETHEVELGSMQSLESDIVEMQYGIKKIKELKKEIKATYEKTVGKIDTDLSEYENKSKDVGIEPEKVESFKKLKDLKIEMENLIKQK
jgi:succinate dehydrogenase flavin-adding protein (antitoxin of CptAB toxin-antitoxin module)